MLSEDFNLKRFDNINVKTNYYINEGNIDIDTKLIERVQNVFLRDNDFTDYLWEILISE